MLWGSARPAAMWGSAVLSSAGTSMLRLAVVVAVGLPAMITTVVTVAVTMVAAGLVLRVAFSKMSSPSFSRSTQTFANGVFFLFAHAVPLVSHPGKDRGMAMGGVTVARFGFSVMVT